MDTDSTPTQPQITLVTKPLSHEQVETLVQESIQQYYHAGLLWHEVIPAGERKCRVHLWEWLSPYAFVCMQCSAYLVRGPSPDKGIHP